MIEKMDPGLRAQLLERLSHRTQRLVKAATSNWPNAVIGLFAEQVMRTTMVLLGEQFTATMLSSIFDNTAEAMGVCRFCHVRPLRDDKTMCQVCWDQAESDDQITEEELIAMGLDGDDAEEPPLPV